MNPVVWFEIAVQDMQRAQGFYGDLFGWKFERLAGYEPEYWKILTEKPPGGGLVLQDETRQSGSGTVVFVEVGDLEKVSGRAMELGGGLVQGPRKISDQAGSFALIRDPDGNLVGVWCAG